MKKMLKFLMLLLFTIIIFIYFTINKTVLAAEMKIYFYLPNEWNSNDAYINYWNIPNDLGWPGYKMNFEREASGGKVYSYSISNSLSSQTNIGIVFSIGNSSYQTVNIDNYTMEYLNGKLIIPTEREYITSGNYLIECRSYMASDPIGPTDPGEQTDPVDPIEPTDPTEPDKPVDEPSNPYDSEKTTETMKEINDTSDNVLNTNKDSTIATSKLPKTGTNKILIYVIAISVFILIYYFIKYKK